MVDGGRGKKDEVDNRRLPLALLGNDFAQTLGRIVSIRWML